MKIDPTKITNYTRTQSEMEAFALFAISVAGKNALQTSLKISSLLSGAREDETPLEYLSRMPLAELLLAHKVGQYGRIEKAITGIMTLDLRQCSFDDLVSVHGIGPKTANFFLLHSRPNHQGAVLDTHILRWMREVHGVKTPKSTPQGKRYKELSIVAEQLIRLSYPQLTLADADLIIWKAMSGN